MDQQTITCKNCETQFQGKFCPSCGEKVVTDKDFKLKTFITQGLDIFTHFDSKIIKSVVSLVKRPGELTYKNWTGIRVPYAKPMQLFIVLNALFYLLNHYTVNFNIFNTPLKNQLSYFNYSDFAKKQVDETIAEKQYSYSEFESKFNEKSDGLSKTLIFILIPIQALFLYILFFWKKKYFVQHLIFATHFISFLLIYCLLMIGLTLLLLLLNGMLPQLSIMNYVNDRSFSILGFILLGYYYFRSIVRCYELNTILAIVFTFALVYSNYTLLEIYRFILFEVVLHSV